MGFFLDSDREDWVAITTPHSRWFGTRNCTVDAYARHAGAVRYGSDDSNLAIGPVFNELGPLVTGLLVAGRVGAAIGAGVQVWFASLLAIQNVASGK